MKIHRWQPTHLTPCGRKTESVITNLGFYLNDGVTCQKCLHAISFISFLPDDWHGQSLGVPRSPNATKAPLPLP